MFCGVNIEFDIIFQRLTFAIGALDPLRKSITPKDLEAIPIGSKTAFFGVGGDGHTNRQGSDLLIGDFSGPIVGGVELKSKQ